MHNDTTDLGVVLAIVCVDWRMHHHESDFMEALYEDLGCRRVYVVTYPGPDGSSGDAEREGRRRDLEAVVRRTRAVLAEHGAPSARTVLVAHGECAGHPVDDDRHRVDARATAAALSDALAPGATIEPLFAVKRGSNFRWKIEPC